MNIELIRLTSAYKQQLFDMLTKWKTAIEVNHTNYSPWMIFRNDFHDFDYYLENLEIKEETEDGRVPDTTLFCLEKDRNIFAGAVNICHYLKEGQLQTGGFIGDGIRPGKCRKPGMDRVLMCCDKDNIASAKTIIRNGAAGFSCKSGHISACT